MTVIPPDITVKYNKEYIIKLNKEAASRIFPYEYKNYKESTNDLFSWKWIQLPIKPEKHHLNKLVVFNKANVDLEFSILINYVVENKQEIPLVYYSPSRTAIVTYDNYQYRLFGGITEFGKGDQFSTVEVTPKEWLEGNVFDFKPLTKESNGWGMEFRFLIKGNSCAYLYEWEFSNSNLHEIEELHMQYHGLLQNKKSTVK